MTIKSILVHLAADEDHYERLQVGIELARQHDAHINALFIVKPIRTPAEVTGRGASATYVATTAEQARKRASELETEFRATCEKDKLDFDWIVEDGEHVDVLEKHVHLADLVIVTQVKPEYIDEFLYPPIPDKMTTRAGCGVLVLPIGWNEKSIGKNVLVAWKSSREAARAIRDSLPILHQADAVTVLNIGPKETKSLPVAETATYLDWHGLTAETRTDYHESGDFGEVILSHAAEIDADLIVMGSYGESRLMEMLTGGTTRHVMGHMTVPVLMSH